MKKIIVPTDFSQQATYALDLASEIAGKTGAKIVLMHVIEYAKKQTTFLGSTALSTMGSLSTGIEMDDVYFIQLFKKRKSQMAEVLSDPAYANVEIADKILLGTPYHAIEEEITESDADFIIMGTTGVNDWEESMIGSTAEKVVRHASCPVLTLRKKVKFIIGSSLGGYLGYWLAEDLGLPCLLFNPAMNYDDVFYSKIPTIEDPKCPARYIVLGARDKTLKPKDTLKFLKANQREDLIQQTITCEWLGHQIDFKTFDQMVSWAVYSVKLKKKY